ncbi:MAG: LPS assembly protein LptD, partial [Verrucomicrobiota bacterium]
MRKSICPERPLGLFTILKPYDATVRSFLRFITLTILSAYNAALANIEISGDPITYEDNFSVAVGADVEILDDDLFLKADKVRYDRRTQIAYASGNVQLTHKKLRLLAETLEYNFKDRTFTASSFRAGLPPIIIEGDNLEGAPGLIRVDRGDFHYGEPGPFTPRISASGVEIVSDDSFKARRARLGVGTIPLLSVPRYSNTFRGQRPEIDGKLGYRSSLGAYAQSEILLPIEQGLLVGANLDVYTSRGILIGPATRYDRTWGHAHHEGHLSTGWIKDQGDVELSQIYPGDFPEVTGDDDRGFILWNHRSDFSEDIELVSSMNYLDDSDVLRDFRRDLFRNTQDPDSYASLAWTTDPFYLSLTARPRINNFQSVVERLPELRVDLPWIPFFETDTYQSGHFSAARLRWDPEVIGGAPSTLAPLIPPGNNTLWEQSRLDLAYGLQHPIKFENGTTVTPLASVRALTYETQRFDGINESSQERVLGEIGADLKTTFTGTWDLQNEFWNIKGFRHLFRPVAGYRYRSGDRLSDADIYPIDRLFGSVHIPTLDLLDSRATDTLDEMHLVRLGVENTLLTRTSNQGVRSLATFNTYYDFYLDSGDFDQEDTLFTELSLTPANWLEMDLFTRWEPETQQMGALSTRLTLKSGDL